MVGFEAAAKGYTMKATKYYPGHNCGWVTADGSRIQKGNVQRWVALSHEMFKNGSFKMGDTIVVVCKNKKMCGEWVVRDKMAPRLRGHIDFLMSRDNNYEFNNPMPVVITRKADMTQEEIELAKSQYETPAEDVQAQDQKKEGDAEIAYNCTHVDYLTGLHRTPQFVWTVF